MEKGWGRCRGGRAGFPQVRSVFNISGDECNRMVEAMGFSQEQQEKSMHCLFIGLTSEPLQPPPPFFFLPFLLLLSYFSPLFRQTSLFPLMSQDLKIFRLENYIIFVPALNKQLSNLSDLESSSSCSLKYFDIFIFDCAANAVKFPICMPTLLGF